MSDRRTYMDRLRAGETVSADDEIDAWHESDFGGSLAEWLGMSQEEYRGWAAGRYPEPPDTVRDGK